MTEKLYYRDSYLREFEANVLAVQKTDCGKAVLLDRTAFYPISGGQPDDQGWLGVARVLEVKEDASGQVIHYIEGDIGSGAVLGSIDWARRYDHMQQHSGQHLLSQAFIGVASAPTLSFHLGKESSTIDVEVSELNAESLARVEEEANRVVFENRPLRIHFVEEADLAGWNLRKEPGRTGVLRVIEIDGYDRSACGGTHVRSTGELGLIHILNVERYKSNYRAEFVCGWRAHTRLRRQRDILKSLTRQLSTSAEELSASFQKLTDENKEQSRQVRELNERVSEFEAELLFQTAEKRRDIWVVKAVLADYSAASVKLLASKLLRKGPCVVLLASAGETAFVVLANSSRLEVDSGKILSDTLQAFGGRGGGRSDLAQGGGIPGAKAAELLDAMQEAIFR